MKAKYYRYLFHGVSNGLCYSGCISDQLQEEKEEICFLYLAGGAGWNPQEEDASYADPGIFYTFLVLADFSMGTVERAKRVLARGNVAAVYYPQPQNAAEEELLDTCINTVGIHSEKAGITGFCPVLYTIEFCMCRERFRLIPTGHDGKKFVAMYHADSDGTPQTEECVMCVKPALPEYPCKAMIDTETFACDLRCAYNNDLEICKRHNRKGQKEFLDGHLLLGGVPGEDELNALFAGELKGQKDRIRMFGFPDGDLYKSDIERLNQLEQHGFATWYVGTGDADAEVVKEMATGCPGRNYVPVGETGGLCTSGYYVQRAH